MSSSFKTKRFRRLTDQWNKKLKESGFKDIEYSSRDRPLKKPFRLNRKKVKMFDSVQEYFLQASHYLVEGTFKDDREKRIWMLHAEGDSLSEIGLKIGLSKSCVGYHVDNIRKNVRTFYKCKKRLILL